MQFASPCIELKIGTALVTFKEVKRGGFNMATSAKLERLDSLDPADLLGPHAPRLSSPQRQLL